MGPTPSDPDPEGEKWDQDPVPHIINNICDPKHCLYINLPIQAREAAMGSARVDDGRGTKMRINVVDQLAYIFAPKIFHADFPSTVRS